MLVALWGLASGLMEGLSTVSWGGEMGNRVMERIVSRLFYVELFLPLLMIVVRVLCYI